MTKAEESAFAETVTEAPPAVVSPLRAGWVTRAIYCLALLALVLSSMGQTSSWIGLAMGGGLIGAVGPSVFLLIGAAILYRVYRVARYRSALDARPPYLLGWLVRWLGWFVMLAGAAGMVSMFLVKPLTMMIFKSAGENGIGFFVVGLYATILAGAGWIGCMLFEISRVVGKRVTPAAPGRSRGQRIRDRVILASLAVLAIALPSGLRLVQGTPCRGPTLGQCAAKVEGGVLRLATAAVGAPVALESNIDEIEFRHSSGREWVLTERPANSLLTSGHPVAQGSESDVKVTIDAAAAGKGARIVLTVSEKGEQTAQFTTRFESRARMEPSASGKRKLVVELARAVEAPLLMRGDKERGHLDEVYQQMRLAIGSPREVAEAAKRVNATAILAGTTEVPTALKIGDARLAKNCEGLIKLGPGNAETDLAPSSGSFLAQATFLSQPGSAPTVLLHRNDLMHCQDGAVWFAAQLLPGRQIQIRKYDAMATLQRNLLVSVPPRPQGVYDFIDATSLAEQEGQVQFSLIVNDGKKRVRESFKVKL
jgi:hypothetical protein